jgi:hypothetical protein
MYVLFETSLLVEFHARTRESSLALMMKSPVGEKDDEIWLFTFRKPGMKKVWRKKHIRLGLSKINSTKKAASILQ